MKIRDKQDALKVLSSLQVGDELLYDHEGEPVRIAKDINNRMILELPASLGIYEISKILYHSRKGYHGNK